MGFVLSPTDTTTNPDAIPQNGYLDLADDIYGVFLEGSGGTLDLGSTTVNNERPFVLAGVPIAFWSARLESEFTVEGDFTVYVVAQQAVADADLRIRVRLSKITAGGSAIESPIFEADAAESMTVGSDTTHELIGTIPTPVTMAPGERFIFRIVVFPVTGGFGAGSPAATLSYNAVGGTACNLDSGFPAFLLNLSFLSLRGTTVTGIGSFVDMRVFAPGGLKTATMATSAGGTEIAFTRAIQDGTIAVTEITGAVIASTSNATTYASASFTPVVDRLYLLAVVHSDAAAETTVPTVATTTGLVFVQVGSSVAFNTIASNANRLTLFRAMKPSGLSSGTYTVTLGDAGTGCAAILAEVTGMNITGTDGANAVTNIVTNAADTGANPTVTLAAFQQSYNGVFACVGSSIATAPTAGSGFTGLSHPDYATPTSGAFAEWRATSDTSVDCALATSNWAAIAVELVAATTNPQLEWISPRVTNGFILDTASDISGTIYFHESNALANAGARVKVYHRLPNGTETLVYTWTTTGELATTATAYSIAGGTLNAAKTFHEDDRIVLRTYLTNVGTMAAGYTGTVSYDAGSGTGLSFVLFFASFSQKSESQGPSRITDGLTLGGVAN